MASRTVISATQEDEKSRVILGHILGLRVSLGYMKLRLKRKEKKLMELNKHCFYCTLKKYHKLQWRYFKFFF